MPPTRVYYFKLKIMTREIQNSLLACLIVRHHLPAHLAATFLDRENAAAAAFCDFALGGWL
jgi:hypothetical protein